jgi:hypothetical protein
MQATVASLSGSVHVKGYCHAVLGRHKFVRLTKIPGSISKPSICSAPGILVGARLIGARRPEYLARFQLSVD